MNFRDDMLFAFALQSLTGFPAEIKYLFKCCTILLHIFNVLSMSFYIKLICCFIESFIQYRVIQKRACVVLLNPLFNTGWSRKGRVLFYWILYSIPGGPEKGVCCFIESFIQYRVVQKRACTLCRLIALALYSLCRVSSCFYETIDMKIYWKDI